MPITPNQTDLPDMLNMDCAFGAHLAKAFEGLNPAQGTKAFQAFLARPVNRKIFRTEQLDGPSMLYAVRSSLKAAAISSGVELNLPELPFVGYFRKSGLNLGDDKQAIRKSIVWNGKVAPDGRNIELKLLPVEELYTFKAMAWDKPSLEMVILAIYGFLADAAYQNQRFPVRYAVAGEELTGITGFIRDERNLTFMDESFIDDKSRLWTSSSDIRVSSQIPYGTAGITIPDSVRLYFITCGFCGDADYPVDICDYGTGNYDDNDEVVV